MQSISIYNDSGKLGYELGRVDINNNPLLIASIDLETVDQIVKGTSHEVQKILSFLLNLSLCQNLT